jgi:hypothetical protein
MGDPFGRLSFCHDLFDGLPTHQLPRPEIVLIIIPKVPSADIEARIGFIGAASLRFTSSQGPARRMFSK